MDNRNDYFNYYNNISTKPPRRKRKAVGYIAIILVTSLVSSFVVGSALYNKFSNDMENAVAEALRSAAVTESVNKVASGNIDTADDVKKLIAGSDALVGSNMAKGTAAKEYTVSEIAKKAGPSIVGIRMTVRSQRFSYFGSSGVSGGEGSGIIISKDGYIMTNYHVVSSADPKSGLSKNTELQVFLPDGRESKATFIGGDSKTDLAVIKIGLDDLPVAELGDSSEVEVGELAVAIGNPLGMEFAGSVTVGVISALNRTVAMEDKTLNLIQTDAAINSGNSGGALLNSRGQVIGINSAKISASGVEGLGFAIPMNDAKPVIEQLLEHGYVRGRPFIGISGREINASMSSYYNIPQGLFITDVTIGSGAEQAGIQVRDVLVEMDGVSIKTVDDLEKVKEKHKPGDEVSVTVIRENARVKLKLTFDEEK